MRTNPQTGIYSGYYRLVESYRNGFDRVCHRTILNAGYLDELSIYQCIIIRKILTAKVSNTNQLLFESPFTDDPIVIHYVEKFYNRMIGRKLNIISGRDAKMYEFMKKIFSESGFQW